MVGYGYIYGEFSMKDYVGGTVTIRENYIETDLPLGRWKLKNPVYKLEKQNEEDFWEYSHANIHSGFGFKSEKIKAVTVFDDTDEWDEFGNIFWIRDKDHLIFFGPVYFLAKRIQLNDNVVNHYNALNQVIQTLTKNYKANCFKRLTIKSQDLK